MPSKAVMALLARLLMVALTGADAHEQAIDTAMLMPQKQARERIVRTSAFSLRIKAET